jgi:DDE superfamily endonuclease
MPLDSSDSRPDKRNAGEVVGGRGISRSTTDPDEAERPLFPPLDHAWVKAIACETVAQSGQPLSRQSLDDLVRRVPSKRGRPMSRSTVWRILHEDAIKPWQYRSWLYPSDPQFGPQAAPILDLYAGRWQGRPLGPCDYVLSSDEKTSIQARRREHPETPPQPNQPRRVESNDSREGALPYLAAWDVHRGIVLGRCEARTGIEPFGRLIDQILDCETYRDARRIFVVVDNGSSHRGQTSIRRMKQKDRRIILLHTPIHASWLNQVEIYFSLIQRKVLTPNDFADLDAVRLRLALYEELTNTQAKPFEWKFTRKKLGDWLKRASPHFSTAPVE